MEQKGRRGCDGSDAREALHRSAWSRRGAIQHGPPLKKEALHRSAWSRRPSCPSAWPPPAEALHRSAWSRSPISCSPSSISIEALHRSAWSRRLADTYINFTEVRGAEGGRWCLMDIKFTKRFTGVHETEDTLWLQSVLPAAEALHRSA